MNKITTMEEAVRSIPSGCSLGLGGMTLYRRPVALVRSLLLVIARVARSGPGTPQLRP